MGLKEVFPIINAASQLVQMDKQLFLPSSPNPSKKNFGDDRLRPAPKPTEKVGRNEPCPCGSGKKHKKCCQSK